MDTWGRVEIIDATAFSVKEDVNLPLIDFELKFLCFIFIFWILTLSTLGE